MDIEVTSHASEMMDERNIEWNWVQNVLEDPDRTESDQNDRSLEHRLKVIPECDDRVLRVIINIDVKPRRLVTVYFDRTMKGEL